MTTEMPPSEPSMEEILASIRQIISHDPKDEKKSKVSCLSSEDILDLTEALPEEDSKKAALSNKERDELEQIYSSFKHESPQEPLKNLHALHAKKISQADESSSSTKKQGISKKSHEPMKKHEDEIEPGSSKTAKERHSFDEELVSQTAMTEAAQAFRSLHKLAQEQPKVPEHRFEEGIRGKSVEDLVRETLKPLLKEWLDAHLPSLVRSVVTEQVEKIVHQTGASPSEINSKKERDPY